MNMTVLNGYGIDSKKGIARCMGDEGLYATILSLFLADDTYKRACAAYECSDMQALFQAAHEIKGVSGNAELTDLYQAVCPLVEILRKGNGDAEQIAFGMAKVKEAYALAVEGIEKAQNG